MQKIRQSFFLYKAGYRQDERVRWWHGSISREGSQIQTNIDTVNMPIQVLIGQCREIALVIGRAGDDKASHLHPVSEICWPREVDVFGVCREAVGNASELVHQLCYSSGCVGKMCMYVGDALALELTSEISGVQQMLEELNRLLIVDDGRQSDTQKAPRGFEKTSGCSNEQGQRFA